MARPTKFTPEIEDKILDAIRTGSSLRAAALKFGLSPGTVTSRISRAKQAKRGKEAEFYIKYLNAVSEAEQIWRDRFKQGDIETRKIYDADGNLYRRIEITKQRASDAWKWLETHFPDEYGKPLGTEEFLRKVGERYAPAFAEMIQKLLEVGEAELLRRRE